MKTIQPLLLLVLSCFLFQASGQLNKLSTFEEMWIVSTSYDGIDGEAITQKNGFGPIKNYTSFSKAGKHQASDLHKIIADTPFLSLEITSNMTNNEGKQLGYPRVSLQPHPWDSLDKIGNGTFSIMVKSGKSYFLFIPTASPDLLEKELKKSGGLMKSSILGLEHINIQSIRIENGTYLKRN